jgi:hypothetical protein
VVQDWRTLDRRASRLRTLIEHIERLAAVEASTTDSSGRTPGGIAPLGYTDMRCMRSPASRPLPAIIVARLRARAFPTDWGLGEGAEMEITNLSSNPSLTGQPTRVSILAPEVGGDMTIEMNLHRGGRKHLTRCRMESHNLPAVVNSAQVGRVVTVRGGRAILTAEGWVSLERIDLPVEVELAALSATVLPGQAPAGVPAEAWNNALSSLAALHSSAVIEGSWHSPHVVLDAWQTADACRRQLSAAGEATTAQAFELALASSHPNQYSPAQASGERVVSRTIPADDLDPSLDEFVADEQTDVIEQLTEVERPVASEQPNEIPLDFAEPAPNPDGLGGLRPDTDSGDVAASQSEASAAFDPEASEHAVRAAPVVRDRGELRYPVTVDRGAGQTATYGNSPLVQDLRSSRRVQPQLSTGTPLRLPGERRQQPPATDHAPRVDDFDHDVVTRLPAETHVTPPPVGFEIGYDDEPVQNRATASRAPLRDDSPSGEFSSINDASRNRAPSSPKVVQPYWPAEGQSPDGESRVASTFGHLAEGFKSIFSAQGRKNERPVRGNNGNGANNNHNGGNGNYPAEGSSSTGEVDDYDGRSFAEQEPMDEDDLPGIINEQRSPRRQPQQQAERTQRTDDQWYRFWR